jgi:alpha-D-ribose 1-methylphosphonate 5-triphosphate synthase subunit PhnI
MPKKPGRRGAGNVVAGVWKQVEEQKKTALDGSVYEGTYHDNWLGDVTISQKDGQLWFASKRSPRI